MKLYFNHIPRSVLLSLSDWYTGKSIKKYLTLLEESQYWSREKIDSHQNERLLLLIKHAYENVPFYRELYKKSGIKPSDIQSKADLYKLPIVSKCDLKNSPNKHLAKIRKKELIHASSSGSTGEPFQYYKTKESESVLKAAAIRGWKWMGYNLGDPYVKISMNPRESILKKMQDILNNSVYLSSRHLSSDEFLKIANKINLSNPEYIRCYPYPLFLLAQEYERAFGKYQGKSLKAINTTGSTLHGKIRARVEEIFGVKIFDSYSCEGGAVFYECSSHQYYHASEEYAIQEFLEDKFTQSDPERPLRHITTDLYNLASPFIRYDTQDYVVVGENEICTCGRQYRNIRKIHGRDSDVIKTPSGKFLIVENFVAYFEWIKEVDQIQVIQSEYDKILIKLVVNNDFSTDVYNRILDYWSTYIGKDADLKINIVDHIDFKTNGKRRTVIRDPKIKLSD